MRNFSVIGNLDPIEEGDMVMIFYKIYLEEVVSRWEEDFQWEEVFHFHILR